MIVFMYFITIRSYILVFTYCKRILIKFCTSLNKMMENFYSTYMHSFELHKKNHDLHYSYNAALKQHSNGMEISIRKL